MYVEGNIIYLKKSINYQTVLLKNLVNENHTFLIMNVNKNKLKICTMSSKIKWVQPQYPHNVLIQNYAGTGLIQPTYVDLSSSGTISDSYVYRVSGNLNSTEFSNMLKQVKFTQQRQIVESGKIYNTGDPEYLDYTIDENGNKHFLIEEEI